MYIKDKTEECLKYKIINTMTEKQRQVLTDELEIHLKGKKIILILR